jgi:hypothetical protein
VVVVALAGNRSVLFLCFSVGSGGMCEFLSLDEVALIFLVADYTYDIDSSRTHTKDA